MVWRKGVMACRLENFSLEGEGGGLGKGINELQWNPVSEQEEKYSLTYPSRGCTLLVPKIKRKKIGDL